MVIVGKFVLSFRRNMEFIENICARFIFLLILESN